MHAGPSTFLGYRAVQGKNDSRPNPGRPISLLAHGLPGSGPGTDNTVQTLFQNLLNLTTAKLQCSKMAIEGFLGSPKEMSPS